MLINPYLTRIRTFVDSVMLETDISHMRGPYKVGEVPPVATWRDKAWQYEDKNGKKANFYYALNTTGQTRISTIDKHELMDAPWHELLKAYTLSIATKNLGAYNKRKKISIARELITDSELFTTFAKDSVTKYWMKVGFSRNLGLLQSFIRWLKVNELIPLTVELPRDVRETRNGAEELKANQSKLPDQKAVMAMGAIQHKAIPWDKSAWNTTHPLDNQRDAFVCLMFALSLSSPNRVHAEQTVLNQQSLKTKTENIDGKIEKAHYLDWSGSKGFTDNKNHIAEGMAPVISLALDYMEVVTAPNRVLARFYKNPSAPLKDVLRDFQVENSNWQDVTPDLEKPISLFSLGYLLGLYDRTKVKKVRVEKGTRGARKEGKFHVKLIAELQLGDKVSVNGVQLARLLAQQGKRTNLSKELDIQGVMSVNEIQNRWIAHLKKQYLSFPVVRNESNEGCCDIEHRLFALNSCQLGLIGMSGGNDYKGSNSPFSIISPITMGKCYSNDISGTGNNNNTIFTRHGFSQEFRIAPHQMRHYLTDIVDKGGLPIAVNNMWGGRKSPSQIIHYVHSTDDEKASVIADILYKEDSKNKDELRGAIRLVSRKDYESATGEHGTTSVSSSGICTQNLMVTPCQYLNDLLTQCVGCSKACHTAHDQQTISILRQDLSVQSKRLIDVQSRPQFRNSQAMQDWFKLHLTNTEILRQLIDLMTDPEISPGNLIRFLIDSKEIRISDLKNKQVEVRKLALPDTKAALYRVLLDEQEKDDDTIKQLLDLIR
ncbi:MAG: hypothetical protein AAF364_09830 [Pseudomonadota bacterium]